MMKNKNCCCFKDGINSDDGTEYEYCLFYCDTEFDCNLCEHTWLEKEQAMKMSELESELVEFNSMKNQNKKLVKENEQLLSENKRLKEEVQEKEKLILDRENNVADFAVNNSRFITDLRRKI